MVNYLIKSLVVINYKFIVALATKGLFFFEEENQPHVLAVQNMLEKGETELTDIKEPLVVGALLKSFFIKLPDPLLPNHLYQDCFNAIENNNINYLSFLINDLRSILFKLPVLNRLLLQFLLSFLIKVAEQSTANLMTIPKLAKVWAPILMRNNVVSTENSINQEFLVNCPLFLEKLIIHFDLLFYIEVEEDIKYNIVKDIPIVVSTSLDNLIYKLLDFGNPDCDLKDLFMITFPYISSNPVPLFDKFLSLYLNFSEHVHLVWFEKMRIKIVKFLKYWVVTWNLELIPFLLDLHNLIDNFLKQNNHLSSTPFVSLLNSLQKQITLQQSYVNNDINTNNNDSSNGDLKNSNSNNNNKIQGIIGKNELFEISTIQIMEYTPNEIARQMTLYEHQLYLRIDIKECILKRFMQPIQSPTFTALTNKFNEWGQWCATEILKRNDIQLRADVISHFIKIADVLKELKNYNSCYAILAGLNLSSVSNIRLKLTWSKVNKNTLSRYTKLMDFFSVTKNYKNYREEISKQTPPLIPYFALYPKYLFNIEENTDTIGEDGLININKLRGIYNIITEIKQYQSGNYDINPIKSLFEFIKHIDVLDESTLFDITHKYEPKEKDKENKSINPLFNKTIKQDQNRPRGTSLDSNSNRSRQGSLDSMNYESSNDLLGELQPSHFDNLSNCLSNIKAIHFFEDYLSSKSKIHLLDFMRNVEEYKVLLSPIQLQDTAISIYNTYVTSTSFNTTINENNNSSNNNLFVTNEVISENDSIILHLKEKLSHKIYSCDLFNTLQAKVFVYLEENYFEEFKKESQIIFNSKPTQTN